MIRNGSDCAVEDNVINLNEVQAYDSSNNLLSATAQMSSMTNNMYASRCVDGNEGTTCHTNGCNYNPASTGPQWLKIITVESGVEISRVVVTNRLDCCGGRIVDATLDVYEGEDETETPLWGIVFTSAESTYTFAAPTAAPTSAPSSSAPSSSSPSSQPSSSVPSSSTPSSSAPSSSAPSSSAPSSSTPSSPPTSQPSCGVGSFGQSALGYNTGCQPCPRGKYMDMFDSPSCINCPIDTTTNSAGSTNVTDCMVCPYPFKTNIEGSEGCYGVLVNAKYSSLFIWYGLGSLFLLELLDTCHYDIALAFKVITFGELIVIASVFDFLSDIYYILNEQFYNIYLFGFMAASLGISLFIFPSVLYRKKLHPAIWGEKIDAFYPGFKIISERVFFLTYKHGFIAVDQQVLFKRPTREHLEELSEENLGLKLKALNLRAEDGDKTQYVNALDDYYDSQDWNPFQFSCFGRLERLYQYLMYKVVESLLYVAQIVNIIAYSVWPLIMFLRIPIVLMLMIFYSSTKLIFFRRSWNKIIYIWTLDEEKLWTLDEVKLKGNEKPHNIDLGLLHSVKQQETLIEVSVQFTLQLVNAAFRRQLSDVYIVSVLGSAFDLLSCIYRYGWYYFNDERFEDAEEIEVRKIEQAFFQHEERLVRDKLASLQQTRKVSFAEAAWNTAKDIYTLGREKAVDMATTGFLRNRIDGFNERLEMEMQKQLEQMLSELIVHLPKNSDNRYSLEEIEIAIIAVANKIQATNQRQSSFTCVDVETKATEANTRLSDLKIELKNVSEC